MNLHLSRPDCTVLAHNILISLTCDVMGHFLASSSGLKLIFPWHLRLASFPRHLYVSPTHRALQTPINSPVRDENNGQFAARDLFCCIATVPSDVAGDPSLLCERAIVETVSKSAPDDAIAWSTKGPRSHSRSLGDDQAYCGKFGGPPTNYLHDWSASGQHSAESPSSTYRLALVCHSSSAR